MAMSRTELVDQLREIEARLVDLVAEGCEAPFVVEEVASLGEDLARAAGREAHWVDDQITFILARHGLIEEGLGLDEGEEA